MASFATSLSGLQANSQDLSVISNNLANLNTTAYKGASAAFQDLFYQQIGTSGDGNPIQIGVGTTVGSVPANFTEGNIQSTGVPTDVAIQGSGFFIGVNNGQEVYIRAGNLSIQPNGTLVSSDGSVIQGYGAVNGVINTNQTPGAAHHLERDDQSAQSHHQRPALHQSQFRHGRRRRVQHGAHRIRFSRRPAHSHL